MRVEVRSEAHGTKVILVEGSVGELARLSATLSGAIYGGEATITDYPASDRITVRVTRADAE